jgi:hypothetical protein
MGRRLSRWGKVVREQWVGGACPDDSGERSRGNKSLRALVPLCLCHWRAVGCVDCDWGPGVACGEMCLPLLGQLLGWLCLKMNAYFMGPSRINGRQQRPLVASVAFSNAPEVREGGEEEERRCEMELWGDCLIWPPLISSSCSGATEARAKLQKSNSALS